jgi:hypothetical protein
LPKKTVETVIASGSDLLVQLKGNQPKLQAAVRALCPTHPPVDGHSTFDAGQRNRLESRTVRVWSLPAHFGTETWHRHFQVAVEVRRRVECFNPATRAFAARQEQPANYLATGAGTAAAALCQAIRGHWGIENRLHHVLDTSLNEDASRIRRNPGVFAQLRHFALNLLRHNGQTNIRAALFDNALNLEGLLNYAGIKH